MKVILRNEVASLGSFGDEVKVAEGYARNYLIPKGLAVESTPGNLKQFNAERAAYLKKTEAARQKAEGQKAEIEGLTLAFTRKAAPDGKLFGSVAAHDIEEELKKRGFEVGKKDVVLEEPIKSLGRFSVIVRLGHDQNANVPIEVAGE
jgi:large subunit ribosomal protein L9